MSVSIKYKGAEIASANTDITKTLKTSGKYCEGDIEIINTQDGGGGITPTGNINITTTQQTDVTNYATAQVVDTDLIASNIKKDVNILGVVGSFEGGGGGGTEITLTSDIATWSEFLTAIFPDYPNGIPATKSYYISTDVAAAISAHPNGAILGCAVITRFADNPKFSGCRLWGGNPSWGTNSTVDAYADVGQKFTIYEV